MWGLTSFSESPISASCILRQYSTSACLGLAYCSLDQSGTSSEGKGAGRKQTQLEIKIKTRQSHGLNNTLSQELFDFVKILLTTDKHVHIYMPVYVYIHTCTGIFFIYIYVCACECSCMHLSKTVVADRLKLLIFSTFHFLIQLLTCSCPCLSICWSFPIKAPTLASSWMLFLALLYSSSLSKVLLSKLYVPAIDSTFGLIALLWMFQNYWLIHF